MRGRWRKSFILGGIAILGEGAENELSAGVKSFAPRSGEMKARTVLGGSDDFARVLRRRGATRFLESDRPARDRRPLPLAGQPLLCNRGHR